MLRKATGVVFPGLMLCSALTRHVLVGSNTEKAKVSGILRYKLFHPVFPRVLHVQGNRRYLSNRTMAPSVDEIPRVRSTRQNWYFYPSVTPAVGSVNCP